MKRIEITKEVIEKLSNLFNYENDGFPMEDWEVTNSIANIFRIAPEKVDSAGRYYIDGFEVIDIDYIDEQCNFRRMLIFRK